MNKETAWRKKRNGLITASELSDIMSASGKIIDTNISFIRKKRFERARGYSLPVSSYAMDIGNQQEPMIFEWLKANLMDGEYAEDLVYSKDDELQEIPFWVAPDCPLGASPDAFTRDERVVFEFKTLVGNEATEFFADANTSYGEKRERVVKEHLPQIVGQFISNPKVQIVVLIKYIPQRDEIDDDRESPLAPWRGIRFLFERKNLWKNIEDMKARVRLFDAMIGSDVNPSEFKSWKWELDENCSLCEKQKA